MTKPENFVFRWDNFDKVIAYNFYSYFKRGLFTDCNLLSDLKFIPAHKMVLSACSPYFEQIFEKSEKLGTNQLVVINEIPYDVLESVLEFAYKGEVTVQGDNFENFLKAAQLLKLKGLSEHHKHPKMSEAPRKSHTTLTPPLTPKEQDKGQELSPVSLPELSLESGILDEISEICENTVKLEPQSPVVEKVVLKRKAEALEKSPDSESPKTNDDQPGTPKRKKGRPATSKSVQAQCPFCSKTYAKNSLYTHIKTCKSNPDRVYYICKICMKELSRPDKLALHMKLHEKARASM